MRRGFLAFAVVVVLGAVLVQQMRHGGGKEQTAAAGAEALDIPLAYADGRTGNLADFRGTPVVLTFWASWCPACVAELPDFERAHRALGSRVVFVGMNMQEVDRAAADLLLSDSGVTYRIADDPDGEIDRSSSGIAMPTTVLITADGVVADVHAGTIFFDDRMPLIQSELL